MEFNIYADKLLEHPTAVVDIIATLNKTQLSDFVTYLKEQVDAHWWRDANKSLRYANAIVAIGKSSGNKRHHALGLMARGDTLRFLGELVEAWDTLTQAAEMFKEAEDEVGWARTWIGRLGLCTDLLRVGEALENAFKARKILEKHNETDKLIRLETGIAYVYLLQGKYRDALDVILPAIELAESIGEAGKPRLRHLYQNAAYALMYLTRFDEAKQYYEAAQQIFEDAGDMKGVGLIKINIAYLDEKRGFFRDALYHHHQAMNILDDDFPYHWAVSALDAVQCYLELNRYEETYALIQKIEAIYRNQNANVYLARTLEVLAKIQAKRNQFEEAINSLYEAADLYKAQSAVEHLPVVDLSLAEILYLHGMLDEALLLAEKTSQHFEKDSFLYYSHTLLVMGKIYYTKGDLRHAQETAGKIEALARRYGFLPLRYQAHLLLGKIAQQSGNNQRAIRRYQAANASINRIQQRLTISLRSDFLLDKSDAFRSLMELLLEQNRINRAFEEIERHKAQVFWQYLLNYDKLRWKADSPEMKQLVNDLEQLRAAHHWYYHLLNHPEDRGNQALSDADLQAEIADHERQIRALTEQLALHSEQATDLHFAQSPSFKTIKAHVPPETLLIEYYIHDEQLYIFTLNHGALQVCLSPTSIANIRRLIEQFQFNVDSALKVGAASPVSRQLYRIATTILRQLYRALFAPIASQINETENLIIVPFGVLHYVPFHLLREQNDYIFTSHAVSVLPSSSFLVRESDKNAGEPLILGYSRSDTLAAIADEATQVHHIVGGKLALDEAVNRGVLNAESGLILHIAAHGEFRIDQPDLSFIELSDGQLMADDLLQLDMKYSLVTLSACETGRASVASADELIGLGRGFLYSGATALLTSLWRTEDELTKEIMVVFYEHLCNGRDKATALQAAYQSIYQQYPEQHVAFWGAFQLIGDTTPIY